MDCEIEDAIKIDYRSNLCILCGRKFRHTVRYIRTIDTPKGLKEVVFVISHATCRHLINKKKTLEGLLADVEFDIFMIKNLI